jgi:hypothetical protein
MAETKTEPKAPEPAKAPQGKLIDPIAATGAKAGFDPLRPIKYLWAFGKGSVVDGLNGLANGAHRGMWIGVIAGIAAPFVIGGGWMILPGLIAGAVAGGVLGGVIGVSTGGINGVNRIRRGEKYAEELLAKEKTKVMQPRMRTDFRQSYRDYQRRDEAVFQQNYRAERENERDSKTYWQDHVRGSGGWWNGL